VRDSHCGQPDTELTHFPPVLFVQSVSTLHSQTRLPSVLHIDGGMGQADAGQHGLVVQHLVPEIFEQSVSV
jgi:hypothetical protein